MSNNRVYVGNLSYRVTWYDLKDYMRSAGDVLHAKVLRSQNGQSRGCGVVVFNTAEDAQRAIAELDNTELLGRAIFVREDREPPHVSAGVTTSPEVASAEGLVSDDGTLAPKVAASGALNTTTIAPSTVPATQQEKHKHENDVNQGYALFVGNLPFAVTWVQLKQLFSTVGEVLRADVHLAVHRRSRGHGTVVFANQEDAQNAIAQFNGYTLDGRVIEVREDKPAGERPVPFLWCSAFGEPSETVYISNLPWSTADSDLVELFQSIGQLSRAQIQTFPDGRPSGNGIVKYESVEDAQRSIAQLNGYNYGSRELQVSFARYPVFSS